MQRKYNVLQ